MLWIPPTSPTGCYFACRDWYSGDVNLQPDYETAFEFRELSDFQNVPFIHGRYEADQ